MRQNSERYVLHASAAAAWWQKDHPLFRHAHQLREDIYRQRTRVVAIDNMPVDVLSIIASSWEDGRELGMEPSLEAQVANVFSTFQFMAGQRCQRLRWARVRPLTISAFALDTLCRNEMSSAMNVVVAAMTGLDLLVADDYLYRRLRRIEGEHPEFRVQHLRNYPIIPPRRRSG